MTENTRTWIGGHHVDWSGGVNLDAVFAELDQLDADSKAYNSPETQELIELGRYVYLLFKIDETAYIGHDLELGGMRVIDCVEDLIKWGREQEAKNEG